ncbi:MAG TPA: hypothetical protein VJI96_03680 [Candidatus Andersenbacteria bacterium]|nr:hypothetical protein [Candidatus Andersenbacteria bacterium]
MQESLISLQHFEKLLGPYGLYQHATKREPNLAEGYCVDDNARAVIVLLAYLEQFPAEKNRVEKLLHSCFTFIQDAHHAPGTYYNFRDAKGVWLTHDVSEDMYARLARTYTYTLDHDTNNDRKKIALELLIDLIPTLQSLTAPRAQAETVIALAKSPEFTDVATTHIQNLLALWKKESTPAWPWFEGSMTYANALLPHSVLIGLPLAPNDAQEYLHASAAFLIKTTIQNNIFTPIGNIGWYSRDGIAARYDQQPIEAGTMFDFLLAYHAKFPEKVSTSALIAPYKWFFGNNSKNIIMADVKTGACLDGLNVHELNQNYGAESMLAYLWAELLKRKYLKP